MKPEEIKHIAHMARIQLSDEELSHYGDINDILTMVAQINEVDTTNISPMSHPFELIQRLRSDQITDVPHRTQLQAVAPNNIEAGIYLVPQVFEEE